MPATATATARAATAGAEPGPAAQRRGTPRGRAPAAGAPGRPVSATPGPVRDHLTISPERTVVSRPWPRARAGQLDGGIITVSMMYTVALAVCTLPHTTCALLAPEPPPASPGGTGGPSRVLVGFPEASWAGLYRP